MQTGVLLEPEHRNPMAIFIELLTMKVREVMLLLLEGRNRPSWGVMVAVLGTVKCIVVDKAKTAMGITLGLVEIELAEDLVEGVVIRTKAFVFDMYHNTTLSMPTESLADYFTHRFRTTEGSTLLSRDRAVAAFGDDILKMTDYGDRTVANVEESERLTRLSVAIFTTKNIPWMRHLLRCVLNHHTSLLPRIVSIPSR